MRYFSGFALKGEDKFFKEFTIDSELCVVGFSYGSQKAFEYAYSSQNRIDRLILLSPAFFQNHKKSFVKTQLRYFKANQESYTKQFLQNVSYPSNITLNDYLYTGTYDELESLLTYVWDREQILELINRGVTIEVFIGGEDKIVDSSKSFCFFSDITTTYLLKNCGHLLKNTD
jgi:esterase/lipase